MAASTLEVESLMLSTMIMVITWTDDHYHHTDGWSLHARFCTRPKVSLLLYSKLCKYPTKVLQMRLQTRYPTCISTQKDRIHMLKTLQPMSEPDGLRKCQNNQACTESVRSLHQSNNAGHRHCMRKKKEQLSASHRPTHLLLAQDPVFLLR